MHRLIMNPQKGKEIDHINRNKLDNRKSNLRICSKQQNAAWGITPITNKSGYRGVSYRVKDDKWIAWISFNNKNKYIGLFSRAIDAARAYDSMALELNGKYARTNFRQ